MGNKCTCTANDSGEATREGEARQDEMPVMVEGHDEETSKPKLGPLDNTAFSSHRSMSVESDGGSSKNLNPLRFSKTVTVYASEGEASLVDASIISERPEKSIHQAARDGSMEVLRHLIDGGEELEALDPEGKTPLALALDFQSEEAIRILIGAGADARILGRRLWQACMKSNVDAVKFLLDVRADTEADRNGSTVAPISPRPPTSPKIGVSPKNRASSMSPRNRLSGPDFEPDSPTMTTTPLLLACERSHEMVRLLLEQRANCEAESYDRRTALLVAAGAGNLEAVKLLIAARADCVRTDRHNRSAFLVAAEGGQPGIAKLLAVSACDAEKENLAKRLTDACSKGNWKRAKLLALCGAAKYVNPASFIKSPLQLCIAAGQLEIAKMLSPNATATDITELTKKIPDAVEKNDVEIVKVLLQASVALEATDDKRKTLLAIAAQRNHQDMVELLLAKRAALDGKGGKERPVDLAAHAGHKEVVRLLEAKGAIPKVAVATPKHAAQPTIVSKKGER